MTRVAIRKIDRVLVAENVNPDMILEQEISNTYVAANRTPLKKHYSDIMLLKDVDSVVNINRDISLVRTKDEKILKQVVLDMDIFKNGQKQIGITKDSMIEDIKDVLEKKLNDPLFFLYVETFKETYIDENFYRP